MTDKEVYNATTDDQKLIQSSKISVDQQVTIIIEGEMERLFKLSRSPTGLDEKDIKKLEALVKLHEMRKGKELPAEEKQEEKITPENVRKWIKAASKTNE